MRRNPRSTGSGYSRVRTEEPHDDLDGASEDGDDVALPYPSDRVVGAVRTGRRRIRVQSSEDGEGGSADRWAGDQAEQREQEKEEEEEEEVLTSGSAWLVTAVIGTLACVLLLFL
eukprot:ANDGO_06369.mRNA.1 hypothetical protein